MEPQCKIGGEGLRNRGVLNEDRISELPEALLLYILSSLPSETVTATSVLSKRWRSLWKMMPNLKFDSDYHKTFSENVSRCLILHRAPVLESLSLVVRYECDALEMGLWIGIAFARNVRKLVLNLDFEEEQEGPVKFPGVLCRCNNTLESLKLDGSILLDLPSPVCFNSLRVLNLYHVNFQDEESVSNLLCGCPSLEDLVLHQGYTDLNTFTIAVPSLQRLTLKEESLLQGVGGYVINAPSLKYLSINGFRRFGFFLIENAPELLEAEIIDVFDITNENILESLTSAKRLSLYVSPSEIKYPTGNIFYQLVYLDLQTDKRKWWNLLSLMLDSSPKLQILKLIDPYWYVNKDRPIGRKWNQPKCVPECLLFHLETFVWTRYEWQREDEKEVATYILKNARQLKKATLSTKPIECKELEKLEKRREMLDELANVVRASSSCHLVLEADTYSKN